MGARRGFQVAKVAADGLGSDFVTIGAVARALGRSTETVKRLEAAGILPPVSTRRVKASGQQVRLYPRAYVEALAAAPEAVELRHRRLRPQEPALAVAAANAAQASQTSAA